MLLKEKHILVTGASSGIGRTISQLVAEEGAIVHIVGRNEHRLSNTLSSLYGNKNTSHVCDLLNEDDIHSMVENLPKLDGVVFCAGVNEFITARFIKKEKIDHIFGSNCFSSILLVQQLLKKKLLNKGASLVFISSLSSLMGVPATMLYAASTAAVNSVVKVLATELSGQKIRANAICPGIIKTPMLENTNISEEQFLQQEKQYPLGLGTPEDVANTVIFHLSDMSRWLTGNIMILDGGFSLQ